MPPVNASTYADPLDILRRFVPTPLKAMYRIGAIRAMVQTNDFALIPTLLSGTHLDVTRGWDWEWKLVRDAGTSGPLESPMVLTAGAVTVVEMGTACLFGVDYERRELLAFIGEDIDARTYQEFLVPFFCRMTDEALSGDRVSIPASPNEEFAND